MSLIADERKAFHAALLGSVLTIDHGEIPSNADRASRLSCEIAAGVAHRLQVETHTNRGAGQTAGNQFEAAVAAFLDATFSRLDGLRPGRWTVRQITSRSRLEIAEYAQYAHLAEIERLTEMETQLAAALGMDYSIRPDVVVGRSPETDDVINRRESIVDPITSRYSSLRESSNSRPILHASVSCKWTIRSDRAQNARAEALNLIRNRKGPLPHIVVVTGEPLPSRLASIALGTGDIDCTYHFALPELVDATRATANAGAIRLLQTMIEGARLRDISDLPLDLAT
ncbi:MAG: hypothetical protein QG597_4824 [Actinomycetota bacterium]|nr:hypothetical protein [Actinomycetota bacterium]